MPKITITIESNGGIYRNTFLAPPKGASTAAWRILNMEIKKSVEHARQIEVFEDAHKEKKA